MTFSVILGSVELFVGKGTGIRTFSRSLVAALARAKVKSLDLLISSSSSTESGVLAGSNIMQKHAKDARIAKILSVIRVKRRQYLSLPFFGSPPRLLRVASRHPLHGALLDVCFEQASREYATEFGSTLPGNTVSARGFLCGREIFIDALTSFKVARRLLRVRLPESAKTLINLPIVYHSPLPYPILVDGCKNVSTIHDLIPLSHPELCLDDPTYFYDLVDAILERFDGVHCISQYTVDQLKRFYGGKAENKIFVAHQPIPLSHLSSSYEQDALMRAASRHSGSSSGYKYILQIGSIEPKKNHQTTLEAFRRLREQDQSLRLVIIGKPGWLTEDLCDYLLSAKPDGIDWLRSASYSTLTKYLQGATAVVFPSIVEGWGLPPLEAMSFGAPVVASPIAPCKEACGSAALYMEDPFDPISLSDNLQNILTDSDFVDHRIRAGFDQAKNYNSSRFAAEMLRGYARLLC